MLAMFKTVLAPVVLALGLGGVFGAAAQAPSPKKAEPPKTMRLYVFDCGLLNIAPAGVARYHVTPEETGETRMPVPCFLIAHPRGTLMWDVGVIPDETVEAMQSKGGAHFDVNPVSAAVVIRTLKSQLAAIGYSPSDITYVAISHAHKDHSANLNAFAASTWLVRPAEREFMWKKGNERVEPSFYTKLEHSKSIDITRNESKDGEYDVFGDGKVIIKAAPGHTPGHQVLILQLASLGRVMIAGDLYHYLPERTLHRAPPDNEFSVQQSADSRTKIEEYAKKTNTTLWIEHEWAANAKLKKSPAYYE
jgi:glyoxylase-like metal-dependent hydrolase (beta-lactamase superfamily II)